MNPQIAHNIVITRKLYGATQGDFAKKFTSVSRAMQQSYETSKAEPSNLYVAELAAITGLSVEVLTTRQISPKEVKIVEKAENTEDSSPSGTENPDMYQNHTSSGPLANIAKPTEKPKPGETDLEVAVRIHAQTIDKLTDLIIRIVGNG